MIRIAMWSGPRNISTALMRSFEARGDCQVVDEPLYAAYLAATGVEHPGRDAILASQPTDPVEALEALDEAATGDAPALQFEKHMAQHWQPDWPLDAMTQARHAFLIRKPEAVVASYARVRDSPDAKELGLLQQADLVEALQRAGQRAVVMDGDELRANPGDMLPRLCEALQIPYTDAMLSWPAGRRDTDGVWAPFWYGRVEASTSFTRATHAPPCPDHLAEVVTALKPAYDRLYGLRIGPSPDT
ncbi:MAG: hypothetical protein KTR31_23585 [Myxococcales bacterium]|nr:hypothetical protein [Myxococcales bacterium]